MNYRLSFENSIENYSNLISHIYIIIKDWYMKTLLTNKTRKKKCERSKKKINEKHNKHDRVWKRDLL